MVKLITINETSKNLQKSNKDPNMYFTIWSRNCVIVLIYVDYYYFMNNLQSTYLIAAKKDILVPQRHHRLFETLFLQQQKKIPIFVDID